MHAMTSTANQTTTAFVMTAAPSGKLICSIVRRAYLRCARKRSLFHLRAPFTVDAESALGQPLLDRGKVPDLVARSLARCTKLANTVRYLGIGVDQAVDIAEQADVELLQAGRGRRPRRPQTGQEPTISADREFGL